MVYLILIVILFCLFLLIQYLCCIKEVDHLCRQLTQIEAGSHMELTSHIRNRHFLSLYQKLNQVLAAGRTAQIQSIHSQKQLKQTISSIAHDIRTPLTSAAGYLQMMLENTQDQKSLRYGEIIEKRLDELKNMLEELFLYTKLTNPDYTLECQKVAIYPILSDAMVGMYHLIEEREISPAVVFEEEAVYYFANSDALGRIFRNLIHNALLHGSNDLTIYQHDNVLEFGNSLSAETAQNLDPTQLFERFYKADQTRRKGSSGLGLAIVKELMQRMGGSASACIKQNQLVIRLTFLSDE